MGQLVRDEEDQMQISAAHSSISCRMMSTQTVLDHIIFRLTPTRTRFDLYVVAGSMTEKLASGLVTPFLCHLQTAEEQFRMGGYSIRLKPDDGHGHSSANASSWFTKGTVDRFVRFVNSPDVIERVITIESEIVELEDRIGMQTGLDHYPTAVTAADDSLSLAESPSSFSTQQDHWKAMSVTERTSYSTRIREIYDNGSTLGKNAREQLLGALDARRFILQKEQGMAFARAAAAGFMLVHLMQLIVFSDCFRALRLKEACTKFVTLCQKRQMAGFCSVDAIDEDLVAAVTRAGCALIFMSEKEQCKDQTCRIGEPDGDLTIQTGPPKDCEDDDDAEDDGIGSRISGHRSSTAATAKEFPPNGYDIKYNSSLFRHGQRSNQGCFKVFPDHEHISDSGFGKDCDDDTAASLRTNGHQQSSTAAGQIRPDASCATKGDPFLSQYDEHSHASRRQEMGFNDLFEHPAFFHPRGTCRSPPQPVTVSPHLRRLRMRACNDMKVESPNHFRNSISHGRDEFEKRHDCPVAARQNEAYDHGSSTDGTDSSLHFSRSRQSPGGTEDVGMSLLDMVADEHAPPSSLQKCADGADFGDRINPRMSGVKKASPIDLTDSERETESSRSSDSRLLCEKMTCVAPVSGRRENAPAFDRSVMVYDTVSLFSDQERDRSPGRRSKKRLEFEEPEKALCRQEVNNVNMDVDQGSPLVCSQRLPQDLRIQNACFEVEEKQGSHIYDMMSKIALMVNRSFDAKEAEDEGEEEEEKQIRSPSERIHVMENGVAAADQAQLPSTAKEVPILATEERVKRFVDQYNEKKKEVKWRGAKKGPECGKEKTWKLVLEKKKEEMAKAKRAESLGRATGVEDMQDEDGIDRRHSSVKYTVNPSIARAKSRPSASVFGSSVGWNPSSSPRGLASASANRISPSAAPVSAGIAASLDNAAHDQVTFPALKGRNMPSARSADWRIAPASRSSISDGRMASITGNERRRALNPAVLPTRSPTAKTFPAVKKEYAVAATTTVSSPTDADVCEGSRPLSAKPGDTVSPKTTQKDSVRVRPLGDKGEDGGEDLEEGRRTLAKSCDQASVGSIELANAGARRATDGKAADGDAKFGIDARKFRHRRARGYGDGVRELQAADLISDQNLIRSRGKMDQIRLGSNQHQHNIDEDLVVANTGARHATDGDGNKTAVVDDDKAKCEIDGRKEHRFDAADPLPTMLTTDQDLQKRVIRLRSEEEAMDQIQSACADEEDHEVMFAPARSVNDDRHRSVLTILSRTKAQADIQLRSFGRPFLAPAAMSARSIASERASTKASAVLLASAVQSSLGAMAAVAPADSASLVQRSSAAVSAVMPDSPPPNCCWASIANLTPPFHRPLHRILHTHSITSRSRPKLQSNPAFSTRQDPSIARDDPHASKCLPSFWRNAHRRGALTVPVGHENSDTSEAGDGTKQQSEIQSAQRCASAIVGRNASKSRSRSRSSLMRCMGWKTKEDSEAEAAAAERGRKQWLLSWKFERTGCAREVGVVEGG